MTKSRLKKKTIDAKTLARIPEGGDIVKVKIMSATNSSEEGYAEKERRKWEIVTCQESSSSTSIGCEKRY